MHSWLSSPPIAKVETKRRVLPSHLPTHYIRYVNTTEPPTFASEEEKPSTPSALPLLQLQSDEEACPRDLDVPVEPTSFTPSALENTATEEGWITSYELYSGHDQHSDDAVAVPSTHVEDPIDPIDIPLPSTPVTEECGSLASFGTATFSLPGSPPPAPIPFFPPGLEPPTFQHIAPPTDDQIHAVQQLGRYRSAEHREPNVAETWLQPVPAPSKSQQPGRTQSSPRLSASAQVFVPRSSTSDWRTRPTPQLPEPSRPRFIAFMDVDPSSSDYFSQTHTASISASCRDSRTACAKGGAQATMVIGWRCTAPVEDGGVQANRGDLHEGLSVRRSRSRCVQAGRDQHTKGRRMGSTKHAAHCA